MRKKNGKNKVFSSLKRLKINFYICLFSLHKVKIWLLLNLLLSCKCLSDRGKLKDEDKKIKLVNKNITCWTGWTGNNLILMVWVLCYFVLQSSWGRTQTVIITESSQPPPTQSSPLFVLLKSSSLASLHRWAGRYRQASQTTSTSTTTTSHNPSRHSVSSQSSPVF